MGGKKRGAMHRHDRKADGFDKHLSRPGPAGGGKAEGKSSSGKAWHIFDARNAGGWPFEPHYRITLRARSLPGNHMRNVEEPAKTGHGRSGA